jgi:HK97 family phage portal protein
MGKTNLKTYSFNFNDWLENDTGSSKISLEHKLALKRIFYTCDWIYILVDLIAKEFASVTPKVYSKQIQDGNEVFKLNTAHPIQYMLDEPSKKHDSLSFYYSICAELILTGDTIVYHAEALNQLHWIPIELFNITQDNEGNLSYRVNNKSIPFLENEIIHLKFPSLTWDTPYGLSPLLAGIPSIKFNQSTGSYLNKYFDKGALPQVILETEVAGSLETLKLLKRQFDFEYTGKANQRGSLVLPKGVKATTIDVKIADQQLKELLTQNREVLINLFHAPKHALSLQETGSLGSNEHKQALKYFWQSTIKTLHKKFTLGLNSKLKKQLAGSVIDYDYSEVEILKDDLLSKAELATKMLSTKTINEVRKELWELPSVTGGDVILSLKPQAQPVQQVQPAQAQLGVTQDEPNIVIETKEIAEVKSDIEKHQDFKEMFDAHQKELNKTKYDLFKEHITSYLTKQTEVALKLLQSEKATFDLDAYIKRLNKLLNADKVEREYLREYATFLQPNLDAGYNSQVNLIFNQEAKTEVALLRERTKDGEVAILKERGLKTFAWLNETTTSKISAIIAESVAANKTVSEITNILLDEIPPLIASRANTIARTESLTAASIGQWGAAQNAKKVDPNLVKIWITGNDERVRGNPDGKYPDAKDNHWELHGTVAKIDDEFKNGLRFPRDTQGKPEQTINCRCAFSLIHPDDLAALKEE